MTAYGTWTLQDFRDVVRREVMDTSSRWFSDAEIDLHLNDWLTDVQAQYEFKWAIQTITVGSTTGSHLLIPISTFSPAMMRNEAVYYNGFRLAGRLLQDLEVGNPVWRSELIGTNTFDTPRAAVMYPDSQSILIWPTPPAPTGTFSNVFVFEYPQQLSMSSATDTAGVPIWAQWSAKYYVCAKLFMRPGHISDPTKGQKYWVLWQKANDRVRKLWHSYLPERFRRLQPGQHYEWEIQTPPPAWDCGTNTATGT